MSDAPSAIRPAATILLVRDEPAFQVLMVKRHHQIDFASGALVFPGGKTHAGDHDPLWREHASGWDAAPEAERALRIAAIREAYEETGVLLARDGRGEIFAGDDRANAARDEVAHDRRSFLDLARTLDLRLDLEALSVFARWITPDLMPKRFDTWFYVASAPAGQLAACDGWETVDSEWIAPGEALRLAAAGERKVIFPTRMNLQLLAEAADGRDAIARARARRLVTVEPQVRQRPEGPALVIPADAGYGAVEEPLSALDG
ncbi:NUDIX hydrolase [Caulobacter sp. CCUG 60055]|uniref:NUDIX hydrolase n=1 Tax=Caulobacter sp. CCUG 60055 TaxID=2100090 RepID=UPI001FA7E1FD|nr:NUDIX domain-containing protein [Caulobacter sp. CCUG 60055]MCI3182077.1 NUDIX hydrolase [Caulobacter sp. CCUG 60055]